MRSFFALLEKEMLLELRGKETIVVMYSLAFLFSVIVSSGVQQSFLAEAEVVKLYPTLLWSSLLFSATIALGRSYDNELENRALEGLILAGAGFWELYAAKAISATVMVFLGHSGAALALALLLDVPVFPIAGELLGLSLLVVFAYSSIATLTSAMSSTSRLKGLLLPLILLPLLFPLLFAAIELTHSLLEGSTLSLESGWFSLIMGLDVVYFVLGLNLYEFVIKE